MRTIFFFSEDVDGRVVFIDDYAFFVFTFTASFTLILHAKISRKNGKIGQKSHPG
jgi:hypothetical protein